MAEAPDVEFVQFVDGDCEAADGWLDTARTFLQGNPTFAIACGRRRERHPEESIYNRLCDIEWNTPVGESTWCGGDAMIRATAFRQINGYDPNVIAGEEPEMCVRMRQHGWKIMRLDAEMTLHDAAMTRFGQWWKRNVRSGHAYAEGYAMHGAPPERHFARDVRSNWLLGLVLPVIAIAAGALTWGWGLILFGIYPLLALRMYVRLRNAEMSSGDKLAFMFFTILGKFPHVIGQIKYMLNRATGRRSKVIEYKGPRTEVSSKGVVA